MLDKQCFQHSAVVRTQIDGASRDAMYRSCNFHVENYVKKLIEGSTSDTVSPQPSFLSGINSELFHWRLEEPEFFDWEWFVIYNGVLSWVGIEFWTDSRVTVLDIEIWDR